MKYYPAFSDHYIRLTGIVAIESAYLDHSISVALARVNGRPESLNKGSDFRPDLGGKITELENTAGTPSFLKEALSVGKSVVEDRNYAIHGITGYRAPDLQSEKSGMAARGPYYGKDIVRDEAFLSGLIARIGTIHDALVQYLGVEELDTARKES